MSRLTPIQRTLLWAYGEARKRLHAAECSGGDTEGPLIALETYATSPPAKWRHNTMDFTEGPLIALETYATSLEATFPKL